MTTLLRLKIRRFINRRSNGVVEQIESVMRRLQQWTEKLDAEQDAAAAALAKAISEFDTNAQEELERMEAQIIERREAIKSERANTERAYNAIIDEAKSEADKARKVASNVEKLTA